MTFSQIPYHRADLAAWKAQVEDQTKRFLEAKTFEEADEIYRNAELSSAEFDTMITLASIRRDIDTRDEFYDAEDTYYKQQMPTMQAAFKAWTTATLESPFRKELEAKYGILKECFGDELGAQRIAGHQNGAGEIAFLCGDMRRRDIGIGHGSSPFLFSQ